MKPQIWSALEVCADTSVKPVPADASLAAGVVVTAGPLPQAVLVTGGAPFAVRRAFSCLIEPAVGDRILIADMPDGFHMIAILDRPAATGACLTLPSAGPLTIAADDLRIVAQREATIEAGAVTLRGGALSLMSDTITLLGRLATVVAETIRLSSKTQDVSADTIASKSLDRVSIVERADVLRAGSLTQTITETAVTTAPIAVIAAEEDLRLDGKRVTVG